MSQEENQINIKSEKWARKFVSACHVNKSTPEFSMILSVTPGMFNA